MAYSTQTDLEKKISQAQLVELTDDAASGAVDAAVVSDAIADADELIDSYAGMVKSVPLSPVPGLIKTMSGNIAIWRLYVRRGIENDARQRAYDDAVKTLRLIADGKIVLGSSEAAAVGETTQGGPVSSTIDKARSFDEKSLGGL